MMGRPSRREDAGVPTPRRSRGPCPAASPVVTAPVRGGPASAGAGTSAQSRPAALAAGAQTPVARAPRPQPLASHLPAPPWRAASGSAGSSRRRRRPAPAVATRPHLPHSNIPLSHWSAPAGRGCGGRGRDSSGLHGDAPLAWVFPTLLTGSRGRSGRRPEVLTRLCSSGF